MHGGERASLNGEMETSGTDPLLPNSDELVFCGEPLPLKGEVLEAKCAGMLLTSSDLTGESLSTELPSKPVEGLISGVLLAPAAA